ncbi:flagellar assembly protein FliH [Helicobacter cinaedi PAGU611]|uniref:Flagellar assembly protein FliH n=1 Tax=Helicobacter cinaedi CCUG 18818 = ATCC BAA-847 TaxID=537971 RepID=A0AAI8MKX2_9HELI|nr:flagellar assembly protein FliH [Helicobacter cinaedi]AWK61161.1 flagellar assembly protein FliH [Helicobacter cinaedi]EFR47306.1 flagellar assembly protein FliH [Helicobacter cinaedi CCUG 18818 = ATCC BAA-847]QOQ90262.1 flagellar assembly protein FliH [Helicobacter cinaedi]QOQ96434.1 flagellar assembly protein FliH [Helicobacter cinaedi]BAM11629.1 flagellar assembly protein FliH [Helicobacter cinaedi PAGU611]
MSLLSQENIIGQEELKNHNIKKYEFKSITSEMLESGKILEPSKEINKETTSEINESEILGETQASTEVQNTESTMQKIATLEQELVERLLQKTDELSSSLAKLQIQFEKLQVESEQRVASAREEGYKDGFREAETKAKDELFAEINTQKKSLVDSIITLESALKQSQKHLEDLEKELSAISVDIAKEVILSEVSENSQKIALGLTKELLNSIMDATNIKIKVNPSDYLFLKEQLSENTKVEILADSAVSLGGVVIVSDSGNLDGTIMARYKNLKQSVLENMRD